MDALLMTLGLKTYKEGLGYISNARAPWGWEDLSSNTRGRYTYQLVATSTRHRDGRRLRSMSHDECSDDHRRDDCGNEGFDTGADESAPEGSLADSPRFDNLLSAGAFG